MMQLDARARRLLNAAHNLGQASDEQIRQVLNAFEAEREPAPSAPGARPRRPWIRLTTLSTLATRGHAGRLTRVLLAAVVLSAGLAAAATWSGVVRKAVQPQPRRLETSSSHSSSPASPLRPARPGALPERVALPQADFPQLVELNPKPDLPVPQPWSPSRPHAEAAPTAGAGVRRPEVNASDPRSLNPELELIVAARDALHADPVRAAALAKEHSTRFPNGALGQEASAIAALAECQRGLPPLVAKQHLARWPHSFFNLRIKKVCELTSNVQTSPGPTTDSSSETFAPATQSAEGSF